MHVLFLLSLLACGRPPAGEGAGAASDAAPGAGDEDAAWEGVEAPVYGGDWARPAWSDFEDLPLPPGPDGRGYHLIEGADITLGFDLDQRDPVMAAGVCATVVQACLSPGERNLHGCLQNVPVCATDRPWEEAEMCCPAACLDAYRTRRQAGSGEVDAATDAIFSVEGCIPGLADFVAGGAR